MYNWISRLLYPRLLPLQTVLHFKYNKIWKSWVFFSLFVLKLFLLTFLGLINSERCWKGIFLIPYTFLSISSFLSFFFWKRHKCYCCPGVKLIWVYEKTKDQKTGQALLFSIKRLVITMTPATPTATATVPQPTATTMSIMSEDRLDLLVFPV